MPKGPAERLTSGSNHCHSTVDMQRLPGHVGGLAARQEDGGGGERRPPPPAAAPAASSLPASRPTTTTCAPAATAACAVARPTPEVPPFLDLRTAEGCSFFGRCGLRLPGRCDMAPPPEQTLSTGAVIRCVRREKELRPVPVPVMT